MICPVCEDRDGGVELGIENTVVTRICVLCYKGIRNANATNDPYDLTVDKAMFLDEYVTPLEVES